MHLMAVCSFAFAAALAQSPSGGPSQAGDVAELSRLEAVWNDAHRSGDAEALNRLFSDDLLITVPSMAPMTKAEVLGVTRSGRLKFPRYESSDVSVRVYGDAAVVTGRLQRTRAMGDRVMEDDWRFTKVFVRQAGSWRVVAFHASPAATPP
jgi:uncharacterized protein (TIGR02246 family)